MIYQSSFKDTVMTKVGKIFQGSGFNFLFKIILVLGLSLNLFAISEATVDLNGTTYNIPYKYQLDQVDSTMTYDDFYIKNVNGQKIDLSTGEIDPSISAKLYAASNALTEISSYDFNDAYDTISVESFKAQEKIKNTHNINTISSYASNISAYVISNVDVAVAVGSCGLGTAATLAGGTVVTAVPTAAVCVYAAEQLPGLIGGAVDTVSAISNDTITANKTLDYSSDLHESAIEIMDKGYLYLKDTDDYYNSYTTYDYDTLSKKYLSLLRGVDYAQLSIDINNEIINKLQVNGNIYLDTANQVVLSKLSSLSGYAVPTSTAYSIMLSAVNNQLGSLDEVKKNIVSGLNTNEKKQHKLDYFSDYKLNMYKNHFQSLIIQEVTNRRPKASFTFDKTSANVSDTIAATSNSTDEDGDTLTYTWTLFKPTGSSATLSYNSDKSKAYFTADKEGSYTLALNVGDGKLYNNILNFRT